MKSKIQFQNQTLTQEEAVTQLKALSREGLHAKYPSTAPELEDRLACELDYIARTEGCLQRLVILWDLARYARERQIPTGPGAGTLPGSLTAYCLGITGVDPIRYGLLFERFLPKEDGKIPLMMRLRVPNRALEELSAYLSTAYPGEQPSDVLRDDYTVSRIDLALRLIAEAAGKRPDLSSIDLDDEKVYDLLSSDELPADGTPRFFCAFQQGSPFLTDIQPRSIEELAAAAVFQVHEMLCPFDLDTCYGNYLVQRKDSEYECQFPPLQTTYGCFLYLEQVMLFLQDVTGCTLEQAAFQVRKLRSLWCPGAPKSGPLFDDCSGRLYSVDVETGEFVPLRAEPDGQLKRPGPNGDEPVPLLVELVHRTVGKCHFLPLAILSYQTAYLWCYYPDAFQKACSAIPEPELDR